MGSDDAGLIFVLLPMDRASGLKGPRKQADFVDASSRRPDLATERSRPVESDPLVAVPCHMGAQIGARLHTA
jgi:hypothetical protein